MSKLSRGRSTVQLYENKQQNKMASRLAARFLRKKSGFSKVLRPQVDAQFYYCLLLFCSSTRVIY